MTSLQTFWELQTSLWEGGMDNPILYVSLPVEGCCGGGSVDNPEVCTCGLFLRQQSRTDVLPGLEVVWPMRFANCHLFSVFPNFCSSPLREPQEYYKESGKFQLGQCHEMKFQQKNMCFNFFQLTWIFFAISAPFLCSACTIVFLFGSFFSTLKII